MLHTHQGAPGSRVLARHMPPRSEKHANFRRLAQARTERVLEQLRKLANLSSPNYEFEDAEVDRVFQAIEEAVEEARGRFRRGLTKRNRFTL
jgi:hypothetical protein